MDPDTEILFNYPHLFRIYKSGRIERITGTEVVPASLDTATGVTSKDVTIDANTGIAARLYLPNKNHNENKKLPILIYFHGGAFCVYSAFSPTYHSFLNSLASQARLIAVSVNYRLATEHLLPTAYNDAWAAFKWILSPHSDELLAEQGDFERVFVVGDSAGGNITHRLAMRMGEEGMKIEGMALVHPFFWGREAVGSETREIRKRRWIEELWSVVNLPGVDIDDPWINPMAEGAPSLAVLGCRRAIVCVAEKDLLVERGKAYYEALKVSGWDGEVELFESEGEGHCFHLDEPQGVKAREMMVKLVDFFDGVKNQSKIAHSNNFIDSLCIQISSSGLQTTMENFGSTIDNYNCLNLPKVCKIFKWVDYDNTLKKNCCTELVEEHGVLQHELAMNKEEMNGELWKIGKKRMTSWLVGLLFGSLFSLYLLTFNSM